MYSAEPHAHELKSQSGLVRFVLSWARLLLLLRSVMAFSICQVFPPDLSIPFMGESTGSLHLWPLWLCSNALWGLQPHTRWRYLLFLLRQRPCAFFLTAPQWHSYTQVRWLYLHFIRRNKKIHTHCQSLVLTKRVIILLKEFLILSICQSEYMMYKIFVQLHLKNIWLCFHLFKVNVLCVLSIKSLTRDKDCKLAPYTFHRSHFVNITMPTCIVPVK